MSGNNDLRESRMSRHALEASGANHEKQFCIRISRRRSGGIFGCRRAGRLVCSEVPRTGGLTIEIGQALNPPPCKLRRWRHQEFFLKRPGTRAPNFRRQAHPAPIAYCLFPIPFCLLPIPYFLFPIAYCLFPIPYSLFPIPYCLPHLPLPPVPVFATAPKERSLV